MVQGVHPEVTEVDCVQSTIPDRSSIWTFKVPTVTSGPWVKTNKTQILKSSEKGKDLKIVKEEQKNDPEVDEAWENMQPPSDKIAS